VEEPTFDIFSGTPSKHPVWLEAVRGLSLAEQRMKQIAAKEPGAYFLFSVEAHKTFAHIDTGKRSRVRKAVAVNSFSCQ
jgi:hypothetical protein